MDKIRFILDGRLTEVGFHENSPYTPCTSLLNYLRSLPGHKGVKEGCAEGDCGACTVVLASPAASGEMEYTAVDSCLVFLPMVHGKHVITVENLARQNGHHTELHPVQQALVDTNGSQCGYCTPGFVMSLFALYKHSGKPDRAEILDALTGNLCRCTGYQPIIEAAERSCSGEGKDQFTESEGKVFIELQSVLLDKKTRTFRAGTQEWFKPFTMDEALQLREAYPDAIVLSGATDLALRITKKHETFKQVIDLSGTEELKYVKPGDTEWNIGAGTTMEQLRKATAQTFPALYNMLCVFGSRQIRNIATVGGNIGSASPIGDSLPVLIAYGAEVEVKSMKRGTRRIRLDEFITGYRTTQLKSDELITSVFVPVPRDEVRIQSYKISKRKDLDISTCSAAIRLEKNATGEVKDILIAYGGMAAYSKRATETEQFLKGKIWNEENLEAAMELLGKEFTPISDARSGEEFRRLAARNILLKFYNDTL